MVNVTLRQQFSENWIHVQPFYKIKLIQQSMQKYLDVFHEDAGIGDKLVLKILRMIPAWYW